MPLLVLHDAAADALEEDPCILAGSWFGYSTSIWSLSVGP